MAPVKFGVEVIKSFLRKHKIATLAELKQALGTLATMTVFRKLKALGYRTSFSHRGKYYTLADIPRFDEQGLWAHQSVWFSQDGTLLATTQRFVEEAGAGLTAGELHAFLPVDIKEALLHLHHQERIYREEIGGEYVYFARDAGIQRNQKMRRLERPAAWELGESVVGEDLPPELKAAMILFFSLLDERQRRLYAGLEAHKLGYGGDRKVACFLGVDEHTVARGRQELFSDQVQRERIRKEGGGRKAVEKKRLK
jgi:hypothetical protein